MTDTTENTLFHDDEAMGWLEDIVRYGYSRAHVQEALDRVYADMDDEDAEE